MWSQGTYSSHIYADRAATVLKEHPSVDTPLFLYMPFQSVHCPIEAPQSYVDPYMHLDPNRRVFAGMLSALDEAVGEVVAAFKSRQMWAETLTIFSTDNGATVATVLLPFLSFGESWLIIGGTLLFRRPGGLEKRPPDRHRLRDWLSELSVKGRKGRVSPLRNHAWDLGVV